MQVALVERRSDLAAVPGGQVQFQHSRLNNTGSTHLVVDALFLKYSGAQLRLDIVNISQVRRAFFAQYTQVVDRCDFLEHIPSRHRRPSAAKGVGASHGIAQSSGVQEPESLVVYRE